MAPPRAALPVDSLERPDALVEVRVLSGASVGPGGDRVRDPHRHDYNELLWVASGTGRHRIDGARMPFTPGTVTLIGQGQVHVLERAAGLIGAVVRFREEVLSDCGGLGIMLHSARSQVADVPESDRPRFGILVESLDAELRRPPDAASLDLQRHLLAAILLMVQRWLSASHAERPAVADGAVALHRRFNALLEDEYAGHHDAAYYARTLRVPATALARALVETTGRSTKEMITERIMLEASRLLLFTDLSIGEIAHRTGFRDQLYFSRAFKRSRGHSPSEYRRLQRPDGTVRG